MPTYNFKDKVTGEESERILRMSELDTFKEENPNLEQVIVASSGGFIYEGGNSLRVDDGFREVVARTEERLGKPINKSGKWS